MSWLKRALAMAWVVAATACNATPLPTPPSLDPTKVTLTEEQGEFPATSMVGSDGAIRGRVPIVRITSSRAWTDVAVSEAGAFRVVGLLSSPPDTYHFEALLEEGDYYLGAIASDGMGGARMASVEDDRDGDGSPDSVDCAPDDPELRGRECTPRCTAEVCDGVDNDCDGMRDEGCSEGPDRDGDGFSADEDCDDGDPNRYPGAPERCDRVDNDCNGRIDDGCEGTCSDGERCGENASCNEAGRCDCDEGFTVCSGRCVDTLSDPAHCGRCGNACAEGESCQSGRCASTGRR